MKLRNYTLVPRNLRRLVRLGFIRFVIFYSIIPLTFVMAVYFPTYKWLTTRNTIYSNILDVIDVAKATLTWTPLLGLIFGTFLWCALLGSIRSRTSIPKPEKPSRKWQKLPLFIGGVLTGLALGLHFGIWMHREMIAPWEDSEVALGAARYHAILARDLYLNGELADAKRAILDHIQILQRIQARHPDDIPFLVPQTEVAFCNARLSLLEELHGNEEEAHQLWNKAASQLTASGWADVSRDKILRSLETRDLELPSGLELPSQSAD